MEAAGIMVHEEGTSTLLEAREFELRDMLTAVIKAY
jgi:hypothetical protein